ncbi:MAG: L,D-transpeptidase [Betaproteobacteria bacterium]|nr:L,D-transpeptidase [Betaproteobacteria bacterium]
MSKPHIRIDTGSQQLALTAGSKTLASYSISTAKAGLGERQGSLQTPRGRHLIRAKIGAGLSSGAVLVGRRPTGEICDAQLFASDPQRDWILSRILWLCGCEPGRNRFGEVDSMRRFIYIHGTPHEKELGRPASCGCIRMANADVIELFDRVDCKTEVLISDQIGFNQANNKAN